MLCSAADIARAYRERIFQLGITYATVDAIAGFASGYTAGLLGPNPSRSMSRNAIELLNGALAIGFVVQVDPEVEQRMAKRWVKRKPGGIGPAVYREQKSSACNPASIVAEIAITPDLARLIGSSEFARSGGLARAKSLSPWKRSVLARRAARARWNALPPA